MQLTVTMQLRQTTCVRHSAAPRPVRAFSAGSAYLGRRIVLSKPQGVPQLPARRGRGTAAAQPVRAAFLGVGAPEAILVGVVALVVFGPKGLAQAAKSLGATLRAFAPTIREITSVSQELKSTLEQEIGINEIKDELTRPAVPTPRPAAAAGSDAGDSAAALTDLADSMAAKQGAAAADVDPDIERKRAESAAAAWGGAAPAAPAAPAAAAAAAAGGPGAPAAQQAAAPAAAGAAKPQAVEAMSLEELEAELARRKAAVAAGQLPPTLSAADEPRQA